MANVFGIPITDATLEEMIEYRRKKITDRAHVALSMKNAEGKDIDARKFLEKLKADYGNGVSTLCMIYNATGDPVRFVTSHDKYGHLGSSPYPVEIANGQWGAFLHVKTGTTIYPAGSSGAVVYRGGNQNRDVCDWMLAWSNPWDRTYDSKAYTEIREADHYSGDNAHWGDVFDKAEKASPAYKDEWNDCVSTVSIGNDTSPIYEGVMTLKDAQVGASVFEQENVARE